MDENYGLTVVRELNEGNPDRRTRVVELADGTIAHLLSSNVNTEESRQTILLIAQILKEGRSLCLPRLIHVLVDKQGNVVGLLRKKVQEFDPYWRTVFPNLNVRTLLRVGIILSQELHGLHERLGLVMLDAKPANLCFDSNHWGYWPKWIDFDNATRVGDVSGDPTTSKLRGTVEFLSKEQLTFKPVSPATDEYALCLTLLSVTLGTRGFYVPKETNFHICVRIVSGVYPYKETLMQTLPPQLAEILLKGISPDSANRHGSCRALAQAFRNCLRDLDRQERRRSLPVPLGRWEQENAASPISYPNLAPVSPAPIP